MARADVTDRAALERLLSEIAASPMPLRGIVHAAGLADPGMLKTLTPARFRKVMAPKVVGALHLHELTRQAPLSFFVMYASVSGLLGLGGTGNHAAANTFLDALAHHRRAQGLPALSIDWGQFSDVGMAAGLDGVERAVLPRPADRLTPEEACRRFRACSTATARRSAWCRSTCTNGWSSTRRFRRRRMLSSLLWPSRGAGAGRVGRGPESCSSGSPHADPGAADEAAAREILRTRVLRRCCAYPKGKIDGAPLTGLGMDSLMGLELRNLIGADLGIRVQATLVWTYPTVAALSVHLSVQLASRSAGEAAPPPDAGRALSEDEAVARLR